MQRYLMVWAFVISCVFHAWTAQGSEGRKLIKRSMQVGATLGACMGGSAGLLLAQSVKEQHPLVCDPLYCQVSMPLSMATFGGALGASLGYQTARCILFGKRVARFGKRAAGYVMGWPDPRLTRGLDQIAPTDAVASNSKCLICLNEAADDDGKDYVMIWSCGHAYHMPCIQQWRLSENTCPLCRAIIDSDEEEEKEEEED